MSMRVVRSFPSSRHVADLGSSLRRTAHAAARLSCNAPQASIIANSARMRFSLDPACYLEFTDGQIQGCGLRIVQNFIGYKLNLSIGFPASIKRATSLI